MFENYWEKASATASVTYDKAANYCSWLVGDDPELELEQGPEQEQENDKFEDYEGFLQVNKYNDEDKSNRILKDVSKFTEFGYFFSDPSHIIDNLFLGSAHNAATKSVLDKHEISLIINVTKAIRNSFPEEIQYVNYSLYDNNQNSIMVHLENAYQKIIEHQRTKEGNILIHCFMGRSRSATVVLYYLMRKCTHPDGSSYTFDDALNLLLEKRPIVNPTFQFTKDLAKSILEFKKKESTADSMVQ